MLPRVYHARQDMLRPLGWHGLAVGGYLVLAPPLAALFGAPGLAGAFAVYTYLALGLFLWGLRADLRPVAGVLGRTLAQTLVAGAASGGVGWLILRGTAGMADSSLSRLATVGALALGGLITYAVSMTVLTSRARPPAPGGPPRPDARQQD